MVHIVGVFSGGVDTCIINLGMTLAHKMDSARQERKNWVEPLREWILDMKKATQLVSSDNFFEIRDYFKKVGTNLQLRDKSVSVSFCPPTEFALACKTDSDFAPPLLLTARKRAGEFSDQVMNCAHKGIELERNSSKYPRDSRPF